LQTNSVLPTFSVLPFSAFVQLAPTFAVVDDDANAVPAVNPTPLAAMPSARTAGAKRFPIENFIGLPFVGC
jgi:hypothetical protein